jgi:thiol-disulfide isomerase/thioredoxin
MRLLLPILMLLLLAGCAKPRWTGNAVDFSFKTFDGKETKLSSYAGQPIVLNFWADWCKPCTEELPHFQEVYHERNKSFAFVGIAANNSQDAAGWAQKNGYDWILGQSADAFDLYKIEGIPMTVFIDRQGNEVERAVGAMSKADFEAKLAQIL